MPDLALPGRTLHYREEGSGKPLVLLHAFPLSSESCEGQLRGLGRRFRVIAPDLAGFGKSTLASRDPAAISSMEALALDVLTLIEVLGLSRAVVGGVSMGGYVAMALLRLEPALVSGLVLMNTHARADDEAGKQAREKTAHDVLRGGMEVLVQSLAPRLTSPRASSALKDRVNEMIRSNTPIGAAAATRGMALRPDSRDILSRWSGPLLVVSGELDEIVPPARTDELASLGKASQHVKIPAAGHLAHLEAPEAVNVALEPFIEAHAPAR